MFNFKPSTIVFVLVFGSARVEGFKGNNYLTFVAIHYFVYIYFGLCIFHIFNLDLNTKPPFLVKPCHCAEIRITDHSTKMIDVSMKREVKTNEHGSVYKILSGNDRYLFRGKTWKWTVSKMYKSLVIDPYNFILVYWY